MADTTRPSPRATSGSRAATDDLADAASHVKSEAGELRTELIDAVRDGATSLFDEQRNRAADEIATLGEVLRRSARELDQSSGVAVRYADEAAQQIADFAARLRNRSWRELGGDIEDFARSWPIAFMAGAVAAGFVAGRFLVSSPPRPEPPREFREPIAAPRDTGIAGEMPRTGPSGYGAGIGRETG